MTRFSSILYVSLLAFFISVLFIFIYLFKQENNNNSSSDVPVTFTRPPIKTSKLLNRKSDMEKQLEALRKHKEKSSKNDDDGEDHPHNYRSQLNASIGNETLIEPEQIVDDDEKNQQQSTSRTLNSILLPWRNSDDTCCRTLREASRSILGVPGEIMNLLPTIFSYFREKDHKTILEVGSRLGYSTNTLLDAMSYDPSTKRFATVDLEIRQPIKALYQCEKICTENSKMKRREFFTREGDDLQIEIPFVVEGGAGSKKQQQSQHEDGDDERPIDVLFIDTLHHGAQLQMELERYPQYVRKYMLFHDTHSFAQNNEPSPKSFKPFGWPQGRVFPKGLHPVLRHFLLEHAEEWEEEMNNVVNNGLLVLKRRTIAEAKNINSKNTQDLWNSSTHTFISSFLDAKDFQLEPPATIRRLLTERRAGVPMQFPAQGYCERAFYSMYQKLEFVRESNSPPCNVATVFSRRTFAESTYLALLRLDDNELPMRISLGLILSHIAAALSTVSSKRQGDGVAFLWTCEFSAVVAAVHGVAQTHLLPSLKILPMMFVSSASASTSATAPNFLSECPDMKHEINSYISTYDLVKRTKFPKRPRSVHILIISGNNLKALMMMRAKTLRSEILKSLIGTVQHRIAVYGTWMLSPKKMAEFHEILVSSEFNFELKVRFDTHTGFAMWERRDSYDLNYVPDAKRKRNRLMM
jgi:hypothetical protein